MLNTINCVLRRCRLKDFTAGTSVYILSVSIYPLRKYHLSTDPYPHPPLIKTNKYSLGQLLYGFTFFVDAAVDQF